MTRPFLRWAGSKHQLLPLLRDYWPGGDTKYIEPFAGSARLFFNIEPTMAIIGDINSDLINVYDVVRSDPDGLHRFLGQWSNEADVYYQVRGMDPAYMDTVGRAARFVFLNRFCFNGLYRTNQSGQFNVPYGGQRSGTLPSLAILRQAATLLDRAMLLTCDFEETLQYAKCGDFVYMDPPFSLMSHRAFVEYAPTAFGSKELVRLRDTIDRLDSRGVTFLLSYAACEEGDSLARGYTVRRASIRRNIAGIAGNRRTAEELIVTNGSVRTTNVEEINEQSKQ